MNNQPVFFRSDQFVLFCSLHVAHLRLTLEESVTTCIGRAKHALIHAKHA